MKRSTPEATNSFLREVQELIRSGRLPSARKRIIEALPKAAAFGRAERVQLAYLARQAYLADKAVSLLLPIVQPSGSAGRSALKPSSEELAEFGVALAELGLGGMAIKVLSKLDVRKLPRIFDGLVLACFRSWEWKRTLPVIVRHLGDKRLGAHERLWGLFFLGRAQLHGAEDPVKARKVFEEVLRHTRDSDYSPLHREALLGLADAHYLHGDWQRAREVLATLERLLGGATDEMIALAARQLFSEVQLRSTAGPARKRALSQLHAVRAKYIALGRWERVRSCDFQQALAFGDRELLLRLYFGTPFPEAKRRFWRELARVEEPPTHYDWIIGGGKARSRFTIDLATGAASDGRSLKPGQLPLRVLQALAADFFVPVKIPELHERLYPEEIFNPASSPARVRQALRQTRGWLRANRVPLLISELDGWYSFSSAESVALRLSRDHQASGDRAVLEGYLSRARERLKGRPFSSPEFAAALDLSDRTARRLLGEAVTLGLLKRQGHGPATKYKIAL